MTTKNDTQPNEFESDMNTILETLRVEGRKTSAELYAKCSDCINTNINALKLLIEKGKVTEEHEMVDGWISTNFHTLKI